MRVVRRLSLVVMAPLLSASPACESAAPEVPKPPTATTPFDLDPVDRSVDPCVDFYRFSCDHWLDAHPLPAERSRFGRFDEVNERNFVILRDILEKAAEREAMSTADEQKIGDFYASCMDEEAVEAKGAAPIAPELDRIAVMTTRDDVADVLSRLHSIGVSALFTFGPEQDLLDATTVIATVDQGGLGLSDRDDYTLSDARAEALRKRYLNHIAAMLALLGDTPDAAAEGAAAVLAIETALAEASMTRVARRVPTAMYHKMAVSDLEALSPALAWRRYFTAIGAPPFETLNVRVPAFFARVSELLAAQPLPAIKAYLRWRVVRSMAPYLASAFVDERFAFYGKTVSGIKELSPRWKRCVAATDDNLGDALGKPYVERAFGAEGKQRAAEMVEALQRAFQGDIESVAWMTDATKTKALEKLAAVADNIGYPEVWRDYGAYRVDRDDLVGNIARGAAFEEARLLAKIGKPVDRAEWSMTPPTVNAYYDPQLNSINFPAGILQPPFYSNEVDDAVNLGGIGAVIGHELTHGFDDEGRLFDARGDLVDWWTPEDAAAFAERAQCLVDQYGAYTAVDDVKLNGQLTLGENIADNGGLRIALRALVDALAGEEGPTIGGFTQEQRLFVSWGQIWCETRTPESMRVAVVTDPHSPGRFRVNGVVSNMPEFAAAFGCEAGKPMVREDACRVW